LWYRVWGLEFRVKGLEHLVKDVIRLVKVEDEVQLAHVSKVPSGKVTSQIATSVKG
jgi:hypothetical protein